MLRSSFAVPVVSVIFVGRATSIAPLRSRELHHRVATLEFGNFHASFAKIELDPLPEIAIARTAGGCPGMQARARAMVAAPAHVAVGEKREVHSGRGSPCRRRPARPCNTGRADRARASSARNRPAPRGRGARRRPAPAERRDAVAPKESATCAARLVASTDSSRRLQRRQAHTEIQRLVNKPLPRVRVVFATVTDHGLSGAAEVDAEAAPTGPCSWRRTAVTGALSKRG